jgi:hypothetical protein
VGKKAFNVIQRTATSWYGNHRLKHQNLAAKPVQKPHERLRIDYLTHVFNLAYSLKGGSCPHHLAEDSKVV